MKLYAKLIKLSQSSDERKLMFTTIENDFFKHPSFYKKRLYIYFSNYLAQVLSFQFLIENKVISNLLSLFKDKSLYSYKLIDLFTCYIPVIESLNQRDREEIYSKIKEFRINNNKNLDKETKDVKIGLII